MASYNRLNNQSPAESQLRGNPPEVGRSAHDFSCNVCGQTELGLLAPFDCFDVVPGEDIDISLIAYLEFRNPSKRQLWNGFRVFFHYYFNRLTDLWEGAKNWLDNGRSGKINLTRPNLIYFAEFSTEGISRKVDANSPLGLLAWLGLPASSASRVDKPLYWFSPVTKFETESQEPITLNYRSDYFPADCVFAYQKNWRDYYSNKNLLQYNKYWFPDNEDHFILSYDCENACCLLYENEDLSQPINSNDRQGTTSTDTSIRQFNNLSGGLGSPQTLFWTTQENNCPCPQLWNSSNVVESVLPPNLAAIKFRQFRGDRFTAGSPFPDLIRGDIPVLDSTAQSLSVRGSNNSSALSDSNFDYIVQGSDSHIFGELNSAGQTYQSGFVVDNPLSSVTMSDIYTLETLTAFRRKMGMTQGEYNEMIYSQYGVNPNVHERKGAYIGGFYTDFSLSAVVQQSESATTPLGTKAGQGQASGQGYIGHFRVPDFGWIQGYMSISSDVFYTQGKPRMFSKKSNLEMYFPLFNNLPAQGVRNDELYIRNASPATDSQPFSYEDRYAEYKSRINRVIGLSALPHSVANYDASRIMARRFSDYPAFTTRFVTMIPENVDMEVFSVVDEPPFDFAIGINCRRVFPGPYIAVEGSLSSPRLNV